ncbi:TMP chaperone [Rhodococcus phage Mbo2]|uniref:TMP chaperone n=1 Tax=Rhodococcus phage Mbo2 TaxID=2936911 RepID=A0A9E7IFL6_9CAUD|nr:TMP chaperone [Rhodococcus phage Mbo2]
MTAPNAFGGFATQEEFDAHNAQTEAAMKAAGVQTEDAVIADYWGFDEQHKWFFPDGKQYIVWRPMTEGDRARYQKATNHSVTISRASGDAKMGIDPAGDRQALLDVSVKDWFVYKDGNPVPFASKSTGFAAWLKNANPKFVEDLERTIRRGNPWMQAEMKPEEIRKEIDRLEEQFEEASRREAAEKSLS